MLVRGPARRIIDPPAVKKIYISATFKDLEAHRAALALALRKMGYLVRCMEEYTALLQITGGDAARADARLERLEARAAVASAKKSFSCRIHSVDPKKGLTGVLVLSGGNGGCPRTRQIEDAFSTNPWEDLWKTGRDVRSDPYEYWVTDPIALGFSLVSQVI